MEGKKCPMCALGMHDKCKGKGCSCDSPKHKRSKNEDAS